jgi:small subunit ribosomal protein S16
VVKIRLKRIGAKKAPHYRIVAVDGRTRRDGKPIEEVGYYNPRSKELRLDREAVERWMTNGAQPSDTVAVLIKRAAAADTAAGGAAAGTAAAAPAAGKGASKQN